MSLALIDGDEAVFKACCVKVGDLDWDTGETVKREPTFEEARVGLVKMFETWTAEAGCHGYTVVLSPDDRGLFRRGVFAEYKAGRSDKPAHFWELVAYIRDSERNKDIPGLEADDTMGIMSGRGTVIVSSDKDMNTVPGRLYNPGKKTLVDVSPRMADRFWMYQTLMGDRTDGYFGAWKVGPKKAEEVLERGTRLSEWWPEVVQCYQAPKNNQGEGAQTESEAVMNATLARILRPGDYDAGHIRYSIGPHPIHIDVALFSA